MRRLVLVLVAGWATAAGADDPFLRWMNGIAQKQLSERESAIRNIRSTGDAAKRQAYVRAKVLELIGGLPEDSGPLNARVTGTLQRPGYLIEKVIFESLPHVYVTANLYRPDRAGKFPGILMPLGHWEYGKPAAQQIAANLALKGFVALAYDPYGQGERQQIYDRRLEGSLAGSATEQHLLAGGLSMLLGESFARYRIYDAKRALDYLVSRPEVMAERIGCTGCSGGGTITTYISALDGRIKVAAPACYINSFRQLFTGPVGDSEQSLPNFLSSGLDIADWIELFAPKPFLISSTRGDYFPLAGAQAAYEEARRWYGLYDAADHVQWAVGAGGHGTPLEIREAIYGWMIRWLRDGDGSAQEVDAPLLPEYELRATPTGRVADLQSSREVFDVLRDEFHSRRASARSEDYGAGLEAMLLDLVKPPSHAPAGRIRNQTLTFETEPGLDVSATFLLPAGGEGRHRAVLLVQTHPEVPQRARDLAGAGAVVMVVVPRGLPVAEAARAFSGDWLPNVRAWLIGRNLAGMRAHDILNAVQALKGLPQVDPARIDAEAEGIAGIWLMMAAAVEPGIRSVTVTHTPYRFSEAFENPSTRDLHSAVVRGFSMQWDLPDLLTPERIIRVNPTDWLGHVLPPQANFKYTPDLP